MVYWSIMKIYSESYGCTLNKSESGLFVNKLLNEGNELVDSPEDSDLCVIGTCVVVKKTEEKMYSRIQELSKYSKVKVIGCLATVNGGMLNGENIEVIDSKSFRSFYTGNLDGIEIKEPSIFDGIPINQGCTGSCNFCISHIARGKLISRSPEKIRNQIVMQLKRGLKEVRISSLDTAAYGRDINLKLPDLIKQILLLKDDFALRVGMMEPKNTFDIVDDLMRCYRDARVFKFMHLPVQSGDDRILEAMNREYDVNTFIDIVGKFRSTYEDSTLSTDIISGYHGDDEESHEKTMKLIERSRPDIINITRFSPRPYTPDYLTKPPASNLVKRWTREYSDLHKKILSENLEKNLGRIESILITENGKDDTMVGRDQAYRPVVLKSYLPLYSRVDVEIVGLGSTYLIGRKV